MAGGSAPAAKPAEGESPSKEAVPVSRLDHDAEPSFESITLKLDPARDDYSGSATVELEVRKPIATLRFHAKEIEIVRLTLESAAGARPLTHRTDDAGLVTATVLADPDRESAADGGGRSPAGVIAPGHYSLEIEFHRPFGTHAVGLYRAKAGPDAYVFTDFEPTDARLAWPCWDEPEFKIPFQITATIPEADQAVSNTPIESETTSDGWKTVRFERTRPLPTYLLVLAAGPFEFVPVRGMSVPGRIVTVRGQGRLATTAAATAPAILAALEKYFDRPYPFPKLDLIAVPEFWPGAMENPGAVTFADRILLMDPAAVSADQRRALVSVIAHELSHMWFGDLVTMKWWDDVWLNESFADWMGDKITEQVHPELGHALIEAEAIERAMIEDARPSTRPVHRPIPVPENALDNIGLTYNKGKAVLGMFERWIGEEKFRRGIHEYLRAHAWGNAVAADLWSALSSQAGADVSGAMAGFTDVPGVPRIDVEILAGGSLRLRQSRFSNAGVTNAPQTWRIPMAIRFSDGKTTATKTVLMDRPEMIVPIATGARIEWVMPNADARGYYRWSAAPENLSFLARRGAELMSVRERIGFLGNLNALLDAGVVHGDEFLRTIAAFIDDPDPSVVSAALDGLASAEEPFVTDDLEDSFASWVRRTLGPALSRVGLEPKNGESDTAARLRVDLLDWLGGRGRDEEVRRFARAKAAAFMKDPRSVDPEMAGVALELAAWGGDRALFDEVRRRFETARDPAERRDYLSALAEFHEPALRDEALRYALEGPLRPNEILAIPRAQTDTARERDRNAEWVMSHFDQLASRLRDEFLGYLPLLAAGCELDRLETARAFFSDPKHRRSGTAARLARVADGVTDCVALRKREGASAAAYLKTEGLVDGASAASESRR